MKYTQVDADAVAKDFASQRVAFYESQHAILCAQRNDLDLQISAHEMIVKDLVKTVDELSARVLPALAVVPE